MLTAKHTGKTMTLPAVSMEQIIAAMARFDSEMRQDANWSHWEHNQAHRFAINKPARLFVPSDLIVFQEWQTQHNGCLCNAAFPLCRSIFFFPFFVSRLFKRHNVGAKT